MSISRVPPPINSDTVGTAKKSGSPSLATGHLHTAQGEKTVTQLENGAALPIMTKPQAEHAPSGATVQDRVATDVSAVASPEQIKHDAETLQHGGDFFERVLENPKDAVKHLKAWLEKRN